MWSFESGDTVQLAAAQALEASGISLPRGERASVEVCVGFSSLALSWVQLW